MVQIGEEPGHEALLKMKPQDPGRNSRRRVQARAREILHCDADDHDMLYCAGIYWHLSYPVVRRSRMAHTPHQCKAFWVGTPYLLAINVCQPPFTALFHTFGRLPVAISTLLLFIAGTIICNLAHNVQTNLVGRVLRGAGSDRVLSPMRLSSRTRNLSNAERAVSA